MKALSVALSLLLAVTWAAAAEGATKSVVLVHGAFADGSGWKPVTSILEQDGYSVFVVQEPLTSFDADVAATRIVPDRSGPCVLVGHSWGGMIITEVGTHASVRSLVYVAAFQPEAGESAAGLRSKMPPATKSIGPVGGGFLGVGAETFHQDFAADLPKSVAHFMSISQVPIAASSFEAKA
jgi:pimeloyl-ACP methyl ester carboxylesterase